MQGRNLPEDAMVEPRQSALEEVERRISIVVERSKDQSIAEGLKGFSKLVALEFPDLGITYALRFEDGVVKEVIKGHSEAAEIKVVVPSTTFIGIIDKTTSPVKEYQLGRLRVKGPISDLLKLRKLLF